MKSFLCRLWLAIQLVCSGGYIIALRTRKGMCLSSQCLFHEMDSTRKHLRCLLNETINQEQLLQEAKNIINQSPDV